MPTLSAFLVNEVELPLIPVVADLEDNGYRIDVDFFYKLRARLEPEVAQLLKRIRRSAGEQFNPASPKQLSALIYDQLKTKKTKFTKRGFASTDNAVLKRVAAKHPVIQDVIRFRALSKILGTYASLPDHVDDDGRFRVAFNQLAAKTGRFSSRSVMQTLPKSDEWQIRNGFIASKGHCIVAADFDQQELRVLAQRSGDRHLKAAIVAGVDLHGLAATKVFKLDCAPNDVKLKFKAERDRVKAIQFGIIYGASDYSLAASLTIPKEEAAQLIQEYFQQFPTVKRFIDEVHRRLLRDGFVDDVFGRRRHFPEVKLKLPRRKKWPDMSKEERTIVRKISKAKREAQNFVIQGASATITKLAMIRCHRHIATEHPKIKMLLTLHDELHFEVPCALVNHFAQELPSLMCDLGLAEKFKFDVPMAVEVKVGPSWGELKKWEGARNGGSNFDRTEK
jgi:DNA polymerase-1